jgi:tryptophan synthase alpha chain
MPYLMGGFPDLDASRRIGAACQEAGADLLEVGIPFSDPLADGPVIHEAGTRALAAGATPAGVLEVAGQLAESGAVVVMCYANVVLARGAPAFAQALAERGISGLIVPDLPFEESPTVLDACDACGVALIPLVAPTTPDERMALIGSQARGFIYAVSVTGTTGERGALSDQFAALVERVRRAATQADVPVAVGFGIATPEQARQAADAGADGVIVGSRLVRAAAEAAEAGGDPAPAVGELVRALAAGLAR